MSSPQPRGRCTRTLGALLGLLALANAACAPSLPHLLRTRQYGEALCKLTLGEPSTADERARLVDAVLAESEPRVFLRAVTRTELVDSLGARGEALHRDFAVIIVGVAHDHTSLGGHHVVRFVSAGKPVPMVDATAPAFAAALQERLPGERVVVHREGRVDRLARALLPEAGKGLGATAGGMATGMLELLTLGLVPFTELYPGKKPDRTLVIPPTTDQLRAAAPATMTVDEGVRRALAEVPKTWGPSAVLLSRSDVVGVPSVQLVADLSQSTKAGEMCRLTITLEQPLLPAPTLEESIARTFPGPPAAPHTGGFRAARSFETKRERFAGPLR